jgi:hypothetical protein
VPGEVAGNAILTAMRQFLYCQALCVDNHRDDFTQ